MDPAPAAPPPVPAAGTEKHNDVVPFYNAAACRLALAPLAVWTLLSLLLSPWLIASTFLFCNEVEVGHASSFTPVALNANCDLAVTTPSGTYTVTQRCTTLAQCQELHNCPNVQLARNHYQPKRCAYIVSGPDGDDDTQLPRAMPWYFVNAWMRLGLAAVIWMLVVMSAAWAAATASAVLQAAARPSSKWTWTGAYSRLQAAADTELTASTKERHGGADAADSKPEQAQHQGSTNTCAAPQPPSPEPQLSSPVEPDDIVAFVVKRTTAISGAFVIVWLMASLVLSMSLFPAAFGCNEVLHGRATSIRRAPAFALQGALCDVGVQLEDASSHTLTLPCSQVAPCEANLSACTNLQVAANHMSRSLCLQIMVGGRYGDAHDLLSWLPYKYIVLWTCLGGAGLVLNVFMSCCLMALENPGSGPAVAIRRLLSCLFPPLGAPLGGPGGGGGSVRAEGALAPATLSPVIPSKDTTA